MKNLKKFDTHAEYETYITSDSAIKPNVSICSDDLINTAHFNKYIPKALKFTADYDSTIKLQRTSNSNPVLEKSFNGVTWTTWDYSIITLHKGEFVYIRGNNPNGFSFSQTNFSSFKIDGIVICEGNVMHLLDYTQDLDTIPNDYCFYRLFSGSYGLQQAPELPATTLTRYCYTSMFENCSALKTAPVLSATTMFQDCYKAMFDRCMNLTIAPILSASLLEYQCY